MPPWTVGQILGLMLDTFARRTFAVILVLGVLPTAWMAPAIILRSAMIPEDAPVFGPGQTLRTIAISWMLSAWGSVWFAGQISSAIALVRGEAIRWRTFVTGIRKAPALFLAGLVAMSPLEVLGLLPLATDGAAAYVAGVISFILTVFLFVRTLLWAPLLVESSLPFWAGLSGSWIATRGRASKLIALGSILVLVTLPLFIVEGLLSSEHFYATTGLLGVLSLLALSHLYVVSEVQLHAPSTSAAIQTEEQALSPRPLEEAARLPPDSTATGFDLVGLGPPSHRGWERSPNLAYQCAHCDTFMPGDFADYFSCACGAMTLDCDAGRFGSRFGDQAIRTHRRAK